MDLVKFICTSVFLVSMYIIQIALFVVQPGSVVHWRTIEGLPPATSLRRCLSLPIFALLHEHYHLLIVLTFPSRPVPSFSPKHRSLRSPLRLNYKMLLERPVFLFLLPPIRTRIRLQSPAPSFPILRIPYLPQASSTHLRMVSYTIFSPRRW